MTPEMIAALSQKRALVTGFFDFGFATGTRRLMLGSGEVDYDGNTYRGTDDTFGTIVGGEDVREDATGEAPNTSITIAFAPAADKDEVAAASIQLTPVRISLAALALDVDEHLIALPDPELMFDGYIDQAIIQLGEKKDEGDYTLISAFDFFFEDSEGQRLNDQTHQSIWPGETGLANVTGITRKVYWGTYGPGGSRGGSAGSAGPISGPSIAPRVLPV